MLNDKLLNMMEKGYSQEEIERAVNAEEKAKKAIERFRTAQSTDPHRVSEIVENVAFFEGKQYKLESYKGGRPHAIRMRTPHASFAIETRVASLVSDDYTGLIVPYRQEDEKVVDALNKLVQDEMLRDRTAEKINECILISSVARSAYLHIILDEDVLGKFSDNRDGFIRSYVIDKPQAVYIDPEALKLSEAQWIIVASRTNIDEVEQQYPEYLKIIAETSGTFNPGDRGEDYINNKDTSTNQEKVLTKFIHYYKNFNDKGEVYIVKETIIEKYLVDSTDLEGVTRFPIAQMKWKNEMSSPYGLSLMDDLLSLQKAINTIESAITSVAVAYATPSYVLNSTSGIKPQDFTRLIGVPGAVFVTKSDVNSTFRAIDIPSLDESIVATKREYIQEIDRIAGITNPYLGSVGTAGNTAQGARMSMERARIIEANVLANVKNFVTDITDIIVDYIKSQYSGMKLTTRNVDVKDGKVVWEDIELPESISDIQYDFYINLEVKTPYNREREKEKLLEIWQIESQYDVPREERLIRPLDLIKVMEVQGYDKFQERAEEMQVWNENTKTEAIMRVNDLAVEFEIEDELVQGAIKDILRGGEEMPAFDLFMQEARERKLTKDTQTNEGLGEIAETLAGEGGDPTPALDALAEYNEPEPETDV